MGDNFDVRLLKRALGATRTNRSIKTLYGDKAWVEDLDIINELGAHTGCVNALSWSAGGNLLASGSDDTYLNIWDYNPTGIAKPFSLNTSVNTGHHANIFSVKFMPHSNDRTVVTCAGDSEVRVFDLEYGGATQSGSTDSSFAASTRSRRFNNFFRNARWLNESNTNARVYRSHADRAKRIVTESSPYLFLTCSEDGEVRQWDLRQPSSAYPSPRDGRGFGRFRGNSDPDAGDTPPPLISYKRYALDLNSISCAASQPQYIALGGAHLHCFLHDRRMLGRDLDIEKGRPTSRRPTVGTYEDEAMAEATRCVRRFAPNNKRKMGPGDHGHITACKISDANPNDMVASWSGDHIYSFDIVKSPDAREADAREDAAFQAARLRNRSDRKRKRVKANASSSSLGESANPTRRLRRVPDDQAEHGHTALLASFHDGESELFPLHSVGSSPIPGLPISHETFLSETQRSSERVARSLVQLRKTLFDFSASLREETAASMENSAELTSHGATFTTALGQCASLLPQMDEIIRTWSYPINPSEEDVALQNTLRRNRQASWRFVQASGCLSRCLGGRLQSLSSAPDVRLAYFDQIKPAAHEGKNIRRESRFCYDFLKAILLWLDGGQEAVLQGFKRPPNVSGESPRFPLDQDDSVQSLVPKLQTYLLDLADDDVPVVDLDANRFERDETRMVFPSQKSAVHAFTRAVAEIKLEARQGMSETQVDLSSPSTTVRVMDKGAAARLWGVKVGRSLLMRAAEGVTFDYVNRAFGGLSLHGLFESEDIERSQEDIDPDEEERVVEAIDLATTTGASDVRAEVSVHNTRQFGSSPESPPTTRDTTRGSTHSDVEMSTPPTVHVEDADADEDEGDGVDDAEDDEDDNENVESDSEPSDSDDDEDDGAQRILFRPRSGFARRRERVSVNLDVPYSSHTKVYKGHCNTRTVKDVNYYGLNDEYVVSGSDDGNFFIWDRKTSKILNILEGDGEVVNVVQGHPYEPVIACSGIDSTVKIFGPGGESREREKAERGVDLANPPGSLHSSLRFGGRRKNGTSSGGLKSRRAMHRSYEITSQNDVERRRSAGETFLTEGMLARFAIALQRGQIEAIGGQGFGGQGGTIVVDDNCSYYHLSGLLTGEEDHCLIWLADKELGDRNDEKFPGLAEEEYIAGHRGILAGMVNEG
ncbi:uncharacterized protein Z518_06254 [Rhinocladiella mackenziei CBS 650.93]|uniref:WD repeat-containing protein n=1 Tax=Rhinocladiella mackenziei CBS 650.93 TaxID=1442369 RepID=A0A0D2FTG3_9EURO|nr:uncharacterized protein Z518_06254 [Rhinocladiella mackenziei CBS 650.93]KIX05382.1 hypothetical protein Z518_06254 [Rhinocladiella mackenziei CBS 650.93]